MDRGAASREWAPRFAARPPFQTDGNLGLTAGIVERLMQNREGDIRCRGQTREYRLCAGDCVVSERQLRRVS